LAALLLNERLRPGKWALVVRRSSEWLAAVPGVVWGGVGLGLLVWGAGAHLDALMGRGLTWGNGGLLWASITLGVLAAPLSLKRSMEALEEVPKQWRLVARSCGATRWQVLRMVVLPSAWRGLLGAWLSAFARAAGETAPLMLVGAVHSIGGDVLETGIRLPSLSGGFPHLGVLACDPPWSVLEAELGHPVAYLSIFVLTLLCVGFELTASTFLLEGRRRLAKEVEA
ncbi:MAG: ABC transporter permease subunit, partial [Fibrobacterota bacterium]